MASAKKKGASPVVQKLSILIPVFNEIRTLERLLTDVLAAPLPCERELVVVDDGSTDGSAAFLEKFSAEHQNIRFFRHESNRGKGAAIRTAIANMTGDWAIVQDADLEYDPRDYERMLEPVLDGVADAVMGSRFLVGRYAHAMFFWHTFANKVLTLFTNIVSDLNLTDMETCYKLVRADILKRLVLRSNGFDLEPELVIKLARWGARIYEVPIAYRGRTYAEGKKIRGRDAVQCFFAVARYRFFDPRYCDHDGFLILQAVARARRFNKWLFSQFERHLGDSVLEAGCGIGNLTELILDRRQVTCVDFEDFYVQRVQRRYGTLANMHVAQVDLSNLRSLRAAVKKRTPDSVFCINVIEHIEDDVAVLRNFHDILDPGGRAIILVPHNPGMYTGVDRTLGHCRRYTAEDLKAKMVEAGFEIVDCKGFNRLGGFGWRVSGKLLRRTTLSPGQMTLFERILPLAKLLERVPFHSHNSIICVGRKAR